MSSFIKSFEVETIKSKNSFALWLTVLAAAYPPTLLLVAYTFGWGIEIPAPEVNPWIDFIRKSINALSFGFLPMFIVLLTALIMNIEHKSNTWKQIFILPISKTDIFIGKYLLLMTLILFFFLVFIVLILLDGLLLNFWKSGFHFLDYKVPVSNLLTKVGASFISILGVFSIHFWLSFRLKNLLINCLIGLCCIVTAGGLFYSSWPHPPLFPYEFPFFGIERDYDNDNLPSNFQMVSLIFFIAISFFSYSDFIKKFRG